MSDSEGRKSLTKAIVMVNTYEFVSKLLHQSLFKMPKHNRIQMFLMPGHTGNNGNETADKLARQGSSHPLIGPEHALGISAKFARGVIRDWTSRKHNQAKEFLKRHSDKRAEKLFNLS
jgi:hypothetical protein